MPPSTADTWLCEVALAIVALPLAGFAVQVFAGRKLPPRSRGGDWLPTLCAFGSFALAAYLLVFLLRSPEGVAPQRWYPAAGSRWLDVGSHGARGFRVDLGIAVDNLTIAMLFVVSTVSFLVHLYSWGYMRGEPRYSRFFAYLGLFTFAMLGLCAAANLLVLFIFWELVGVTSYFLIGFRFEKPPAARAAIKAFVTTRFGDLGLLAAILVIASRVGSLEFDDIFASVARGDWPAPLLAGVGLCLFLGPMGKSAQFPLHIWLPDAMEGPTPVSALIHAATMVAAGVYLVGRLFPFLAGAPYFEGHFQDSDVLFAVAAVGAFSAFFAATIAVVQTDVKKVLAYSTISQLGTMMLGLGSGSVAAGLFHLVTHAFFKALLFLGAGSVIHAVGSNELRDMGGLGRKMPVTRATFLVGVLAISGFPFLSGFYSKEAVLSAALSFATGRGTLLAWAPFALGTATAGLTAFYMFRLYFLAFAGEPRNLEAHRRAHESPRTMTVPLCVLAALSVVAGGAFLPGFDARWFEARVSSEMLVPSVAAAAESGQALHGAGAGAAVLAASLGLFAAGSALAALFFLPRGPLYGRAFARPGTALGAVRRFLENLWYVDAALVGGAVALARAVARLAGFLERYAIDACVNAWAPISRGLAAAIGFADARGVDGAVRAVGEASLRLGSGARRVQTGILPDYVTASLIALCGLFVLGAAFLFFVRAAVF